MSLLGLTIIAVLLCLLLLWLRVQSAARHVHFRAFRGLVQGAGGIGAMGIDPVSGRVVARIDRFSLRGPGFELSDLSAFDAGLGIAAGHLVTVVFAERRGRAPQPVLLFNHDVSRWRLPPAAWVGLRGDAPSHYLPVLAFFAVLCGLWMGAASSVVGTLDAAAAWLLGPDPLLLTLAAILVALTAFALLTTFALRTLDTELERLAVQALRNAMFSLPEDDRARRAVLNLAAPRTRRAPQRPDVIAL